MKTNSYDHIIVGSGINALVCAALLSKKGNKVLVLERNDRLGGCIRTEELTLPGYIHDVLSSWHPLFVTSPGYAQLKDELEKYGLEYCNSDSPTAVVNSNDDYFILKNSREENIKNMNELTPGDGDSYAKAMAELEESLDLTFTLLGNELWTWATAKVFISTLIKRGPKYLVQFFGYALQSCRGWLGLTFKSDIIRACLAPWPTHAGIGPDAPSSGHMARVIAFTLEMAGCPVVKGGNYNIVKAFEQLIRSHGGELKIDADVEKVLTKDGQAYGVTLSDGSEYLANQAVICSVTPTQLYGRLLPSSDVPASIAKQASEFQYGKADMQIHLALSEAPKWSNPELAEVALLHLTPDMDGVAQAINEAECGLLPKTATIVVGQPAKLDPSRVPEGKGLLWIQLQELPSVIKGDAGEEIEIPESGKWTEQVREAYADRIIERISKHIPNLKETILKRVVLSPADLEAININLVGGDPYAGACTMDQFFLWRPLRGVTNHNTTVKNLYHIGASTHPGPGLGGGSGFLVAQSLG